MISCCKMYSQMQEERRAFSLLSSFIFFSIIVSAKMHCVKYDVFQVVVLGGTEASSVI